MNPFAGGYQPNPFIAEDDLNRRMSNTVPRRQKPAISVGDDLDLSGFDDDDAFKDNRVLKDTMGNGKRSSTASNGFDDLGFDDGNSTDTPMTNTSPNTIPDDLDGDEDFGFGGPSTSIQSSGNVPDVSTNDDMYGGSAFQMNSPNYRISQSSDDSDPYAGDISIDSSMDDTHVPTDDSMTPGAMPDEDDDDFIQLPSLDDLQSFGTHGPHDDSDIVEDKNDDMEDLDDDDDQGLLSPSQDRQGFHDDDMDITDRRMPRRPRPQQLRQSQPLYGNAGLDDEDGMSPQANGSAYPINDGMEDDDEEQPASQLSPSAALGFAGSNGGSEPLPMPSPTDDGQGYAQDVDFSNLNLNDDIPLDDDEDPGSGYGQDQGSNTWDDIDESMEDPMSSSPQWDNSQGWSRDTEANYAIPPAEVHPADHDSQVYKDASNILQNSPSMMDDETEDTAPENDEAAPEDQGKGSRLSSFKKKFEDFKKRAKQEIGAADDSPVDDEDRQDTDDGQDEGQEQDGPDEEAQGPSGDGSLKRSGNRPIKTPPKPTGIKDILLFPFRLVLSVVRALGFMARIIAAGSGLLVILLIVWLCFNLPVAHNLTLFNEAPPDEGTIQVSDTKYENGHAVMELTNNSDMIAHIGGSAIVNTWSPSLSDLGSLVKPRQMATCAIPNMDLMPKTEKTITTQCEGNVHGIWPRVQVKVEYN